MSLLLSFLKELPNGQRAIAVRASVEANPAHVVAALELPPLSGLLMLSGGAGKMPAETCHRLADLFTAIGNTLAQSQIAVVDGGTQAGVVGLMGKALAQAHQAAPYIGILSAHAEVEPGGATGEEILEPHHSHFILVESNEWGDEVGLMYGVAKHLSTRVPSLALLVNGGGISLQEVEWNVKQGREIIILAGSGRLADEIALAIRHPELGVRDRVANIVRNGQLTLFDLSEPTAKLEKILRQKLLK